MAPISYNKILGDHWAQYIDINTTELLQLEYTHDISSPSSRKLRSTDPKCTKNLYRQTVKKYRTPQGFPMNGKTAKKIDGRSTLTPRQQSKFEAIDRGVHRLCTNAENNIRTVKSEKYMWSP